MKMDFTEVKSSNIKGVSRTGNDLLVKFNSGAIYEYKDVPEEVFDALLSAESVGKYFNKEIKGKFTFRKLGVEHDGLIVATDWDALPDVVASEGKHYSTLVLADRCKKMEDLIRHCRLYIVESTGYLPTREEEKAAIEEEMRGLGL